MFRSSQDRAFQNKEEVPTTVNKSYSCDLCGEGPWAVELDVNIHRKTQHKWVLLRALKDENISMCSICLREQNDKQSLVEHILVNHFLCPPNATMINREIYICDHCQRLFFNKQLLTIHMFHWHLKKTSQVSDVKYNCPACSKTIRIKSFWFHLLYHGIYNVGTCPICLKICENHSEMLEHVKTHPYIFRCEICQYETTKECYFNNHLAKHKKDVVKKDVNNKVTRFFLPERLLPSLNNHMFHIFKGIPLTNEVRICILCRTLVFSVEDMVQHIFAAHVPEEKAKSKRYQCYCGEEFFNNVLLKHHVFKLKGNHGVWDGVSPIPVPTSTEEELVDVYQIYGISDPMDGSEVVITAIKNTQEGDVQSDVEEIMDYEVLSD